MSWRLAHFEVEAAIGVGSYATVHRATDERLGDTVAIKILAENHSLNPELRERFISEGRALRRVGGANVVAVYDIGESEKFQPYLVMEHADRGTLKARVEGLRKQGWKATIDDLLALARPLAAGVADIHRARLVHRDLSPGNILLSSRRVTPDSRPPSPVVRPEERLVLADLGMCKDLALGSGLTVAGGTAGFRPPEQDGPGVVDIRADIWAMSALVAWLAEGTSVPSALKKVIARGMHSRPEKRHPNAREWLADVEQALAPPEPEPARVAEDPSPTKEKPRRRKALVIVAAVLVVAALVGGLVVGLNLASAPDQVSAVSGASVEIEGPDEITVGESARFTAVVEGATSWAWALPNRRQVADERSVEVTATGAGSAEIVLRAVAPDGTELEVRHDIRVSG